MPFGSIMAHRLRSASKSAASQRRRCYFVPLLRVRSMAKDYVAANLQAPLLDHLFPNMIEADKSASTWPYFRKQIDHPFRVDRRNPTVGFINRDEASILYTNASAFRGGSGIEIGAWRGWSTAHLIAAGLTPLHVVEPLLADPEWRGEFEHAIRGAGGSSTTILVPEPSPAAVVRLGEAGARWSFAFIDGDHDRDAPPRMRSLARPTSKQPQWSSFMTWCRPMWRRAYAPWRRRVGA